VIATVALARLGYRAAPELDGGDPVLWDLTPAAIPVTWAEPAEPRAGAAAADALRGAVPAAALGREQP
jgi:hypothetical protein